MSVEQEARELLAAAFDEHGPTGYARHIRSGAADWPWVDPALNAITAALLRSSASRDEVDWREVAFRFAQDLGGCDYAVCADYSSPHCHCNERVQEMIRNLKSGALHE